MFSRTVTVSDVAPQTLNCPGASVSPLAICDNEAAETVISSTEHISSTDAEDSSAAAASVGQLQQFHRQIGEHRRPALQFLSNVPVGTTHCARSFMVSHPGAALNELISFALMFSMSFAV